MGILKWSSRGPLKTAVDAGGRIRTAHTWPSWQELPCPCWCSRAHGEDDHAEDRYHQSNGVVLPVIAATERSIPLTDTLASLDLVVRRGRYLNEVVEWIAIEAAEYPAPRLLLTVESARLLLHCLADELGERVQLDEC